MKKEINDKNGEAEAVFVHVTSALLDFPGKLGKNTIIPWCYMRCHLQTEGANTLR